MQNAKIVMTLAGLLLAGQAQAAESVTELTIYNQNLALIKKTQTAVLKKGENEIVFDEVAQQMRPESAFIYGKDIRVLEQNYDYAGINYMTLLNANVGKEVKTVRQNSKTGENVFEKALLIAVNGVTPVLQFDYGIETDFSGRVIFDKIPFGLNSTPILKAKIETATEGEKELKLAYLASGFSWQANYVVNVNDNKTLSVLGRVALNNTSGSNYDDVAVNLIAGDVNTVADAGTPRLYKAAMMNTMARGVTFDSDMAEAVMAAPESLSGYYVYKIPQKTSLKDGQIKQVSFLDAPAVKYKKRGVIRSSLSFGTTKSFYKDVHPDVVYNFSNNQEDGLGIPLPQGKISFYDYDKTGALQFVGENRIDNKASGQKITVQLGKFFDVYANGSVTNVEQLSERQYQKDQQACITEEKKYGYDVEYEVVNKSDEAVNVVLKQPLYGEIKLVEETLKGESGEGNEYEWRFMLEAGKNQKIKVKFEKTQERPNCNLRKVVLE